jgi:hypothetical protein
MTYSELLQLYFDRSAATQWYWTLYVVIIGGLLAFSSMRQRPDLVTVVIVTVLFSCFAYKNAGAIVDVTNERYALLEAMKETSANTAPPGTHAVEAQRMRELLEPTLKPTTASSARNFHLMCDVLTIAALWAMEWRRRGAWKDRAAQA